MTQNTRESVWAISKANIPFYRDGITAGTFLYYIIFLKIFVKLELEID